MEQTLICSVCSLQSPLCSLHLEIPICPACWKEPGPYKRRFTYEAEIDKITPKVFLGNEETQKRLRVLKALGVSNILIVGSGLDILYKNDFIYKQIEVIDTVFEDIAKFFDECFEFIENSKGNVFVHCAAGISRSAAVVTAYVMRKERIGFEEAIKLVKEKRRCIEPNEGFIKQLKNYQEKLKV